MAGCIKSWRYKGVRQHRALTKITWSILKNMFVISILLYDINKNIFWIIIQSRKDIHSEPLVVTSACGALDQLKDDSTGLVNLLDETSQQHYLGIWPGETTTPSIIPEDNVYLVQCVPIWKGFGTRFVFIDVKTILLSGLINKCHLMLETFQIILQVYI